MPWVIGNGHRPHAIASPFNTLIRLSLRLVLRRDFLKNGAKNSVANHQLDQAQMTIVAIGCHTQHAASQASRIVTRKQK